MEVSLSLFATNRKLLMNREVESPGMVFGKVGGWVLEPLPVQGVSGLMAEVGDGGPCSRWGRLQCGPLPGNAQKMT